MYFAAGAKLPAAQPVVLASLPRPEAQLEDDVPPQAPRPAGDIPKQRFDEIVPGVMFWLFGILTKETHMLFVGGQSQRRKLVLKLARQGGFPRTGQSDH